VKQLTTERESNAERRAVGGGEGETTEREEDKE